ncbi:MAG: BlaI/MecI/CopY family transcriptional regulator [Sedimentisphaerales bacterium]|nr:BlaI/MecI/CopY family transcriptional regulator [Sedimentisphaerales bacterium]
MKLTEPEWLIMNLLWEKYPANARGIFERLPRGISWAYTTVKTTLDRLVEKKAVRKKKDGHIGYYEPLLTRKQARSTAIKMLLNHAFDGAFGPMMHFLAEDENLSSKHRKELIKILSEKDKSKGEKNGRTNQ